MNTLPKKITDEAFERLISKWNHEAPSRRQERVRECRESGTHDWAQAPWSIPENPHLVCRKCMRYLDPREEAA